MACARLLGAAALAAPALAQDSDLRSAADLPHRPLRRLRHPDRQRHADYLHDAQRARRRHQRRQARVEECETGYDTEKGVECYERVKGKKPVGRQSRCRPASPCSSSRRRRSTRSRSSRWPTASRHRATATVFPWIFNPPATYWDGLSIIIAAHRRQGRRLRQAQGQEDRLRLSRQRPTARSRSRCCEQLAKEYGFDGEAAIRSPAAEMQNQSAQWLHVRHDRPDWMLMWGWGVMNPTAVKEAARDRLSRWTSFIGVWWSGARGRRAAGRRRRPRAIIALNFNGARRQLPGASRTSRSTSSTRARARSQRTRSARSSTTAASSTRCSSPRRSAPRRRSSGKKVVTGEEVRRGLETLNITDGALEGARLGGLRRADRSVSCTDHNGHAPAYMQQWDGTKWVKISDWIAAHEGQGAPAARGGGQRICARRTPAGPSGLSLATSRRKTIRSTCKTSPRKRGRAVHHVRSRVARCPHVERDEPAAAACAERRASSPSTTSRWSTTTSSWC